MFILLQDTAVVRYRYFNGVAIKGQKIQVVHCEISGKRFRGGSNIFPCTALIDFNPEKNFSIFILPTTDLFLWRKIFRLITNF